MKISLQKREAVKLKDFCGVRIWKQPHIKGIYAIGADVSEGIGQDASCAQVLDCRTGEAVAMFWSKHCDVDTYATELYKLGMYYNKAQICIECNNHGAGVIAILGGSVGGLAYPNLYKRIVYDEFTQKRSKSIGFKTTSSSKPRLIGNLVSAVKSGEITVYDRFTIQEMSAFVRDQKTGRIGAQGNDHDDRIMSLALAWEQARLIQEGLVETQRSSNHFTQYDPMTGFPIVG